jgi:hypothetical protein
MPLCQTLEVLDLLRQNHISVEFYFEFHKIFLKNYLLPSLMYLLHRGSIYWGSYKSGMAFNSHNNLTVKVSTAYLISQEGN